MDVWRVAELKSFPILTRMADMMNYIETVGPRACARQPHPQRRGWRAHLEALTELGMDRPLAGLPVSRPRLTSGIAAWAHMVCEALRMKRRERAPHGHMA